MQQGHILTTFDNGTFFSTTGKATVNQMLNQERNSIKGITWLIRVVGFLVEYGGFRLLGGPLVTAAALLPVLSRLVSLGVNAVAIPASAAVTGEFSSYSSRVCSLDLNEIKYYFVNIKY